MKATEFSHVPWSVDAAELGKKNIVGGSLTRRSLTLWLSKSNHAI
jgi:hypothetical protein